MNSKEQSNDQSHKALGKRSVLAVFLIGGLMVVVPFLLVLNWSSNTCSADLLNFCRGSQFYKTARTIFPYLMLAGGAIVGYNMKRVYDSLVREERKMDETETEHSSNEDMR